MIFGIIILAMIFGVFFGFALEKSGVLDPEVIIGQFQLKRFTMIRVFLTAIITGLVVYQILDLLGFETLNWKVMNWRLDLLGGALLGLGISLAGACPGTMLGQIGVGYRDAWMTLLGAFLGAVTFVYSKTWIFSVIAIDPNKKIILPDLLHIDHMPVRVAMALILLGMLFFTKRLNS